MLGWGAGTDYSHSSPSVTPSFSNTFNLLPSTSTFLLAAFFFFFFFVLKDEQERTNMGKKGGKTVPGRGNSMCKSLWQKGIYRSMVVGKASPIRWNDGMRQPGPDYS